MKNYEIVRLDSNCAELKIPYLSFHCFSLQEKSFLWVGSFLVLFFFPRSENAFMLLGMGEVYSRKV